MGNMRFKVGDRVRIKSLDWYNENKNKFDEVKCGNTNFIPDMVKYCGKIVTISSILSTLKLYYIKENECTFYWADEMIEGLVEDEEIEFTEYDKYWCDIMSESDPTTYVLPQGYQFKDENGNVINATKIVLEKKKKEYPKTYEECCEILGGVSAACWSGYKCCVLGALNKLLICRDAYWKIAGEEMGLGKPWEPDWNIRGYYAIARSYGNVVKTSNYNCDLTLAFPTEEMRDAFYENFKKEIEFVKELL